MICNKRIGCLDFIRQGDYIFDVGAHIGDKTVNFIKRGAKVVCIEPQPNCVQFLRMRFKDNPRVTIIEKGLAPQPGKMHLFISTNANFLSTFSEEWQKGRFAAYTWDRTLLVEVATLDEIIKQYRLPKYCKIDVEGFEYQVLQGLHQQIPYVSFEFTIEFLYNAQKCVQYLQDLGYNKFNVVFGENDYFQFSHWVTSENLFSFIESSNDHLLWGDIYTNTM